MANIDINKNSHTNVFYVNPEGYSELEAFDSMGVSFPEYDYKEGIEMPDKIITVKGDIHYHLIDAPNIDWDGVKIPWASRITKWGGSGYTIDEKGDKEVVNRSDMYAPTYQYNKPDEESWISGKINESEEVADILNYLIYRVIAIDYFMDHWDERNLREAVLRVTNYRKDFYDLLNVENGNVDSIDNTDGSSTALYKDNLISVSSPLKVILYPYMVYDHWVSPEGETVMFKGTKNEAISGVLISDLGYAATRDLLFNSTVSTPNKSYDKINPAGINFDIYNITTLSTSTDITFATSAKNVIDGNIIITSTKINGDIDGQVQVANSHKLPLVAKSCSIAKDYVYAGEDLMHKVFMYLQGDSKYNLTSTADAKVDANNIDVDITVSIAKSVDVVNGYASGEVKFKVNVAKGDNLISKLSLDGNSIAGTSTVKRNSKCENVTCTPYVGAMALPKTAADVAPDAPNYSSFKSKIILESEFGEKYDATAPDLQKSHIKPYFYVKPADSVSGSSLTTTELNNLWNSTSINWENINKIHNTTINTDEVTSLVVYSNALYGKIVWEYDNVSKTTDYWYYPPIQDEYEAITHTTLNDNIDVKICCFLYYPYRDKTTPRLLNAAYEEMKVELIPIRQNSVIFYDGKDTSIKYRNGSETGVKLGKGNVDAGKTYYQDIAEDNTTFTYGIYTNDVENSNKNGTRIDAFVSSVATTRYSDNIEVTFQGVAMPDFISRTMPDITNASNVELSTLGRSLKYPIAEPGFEMEETKHLISIENETDKWTYNETTNQWRYEDGTLYDNDDDTGKPYYITSSPVIIDKTDVLFDNVECINMLDTTNTKVVVLDEIKANDVFTLTKNDTKYYQLLFNTSTALYPIENGIIKLMDGTYADADNDYFYLVFKIHCDKKYTRTNATDKVMYDECDGYYFVKITRSTVEDFGVEFKNATSYTYKDADKNEYTINKILRQDIYLNQILTSNTVDILKRFTGYYKWSIKNISRNINDVKQYGSNNGGTIEYFDANNVYLYNIDDEWTARNVRDISIKKANVTTGSDAAIDQQTANGLITYIDGDLLENQKVVYNAILGKNIYEMEETQFIITDAGEDLVLSGDEDNVSNIKSYGPILYVDKLTTTNEDGKVYPYNNRDVEIQLLYTAGNDNKYVRASNDASITISKLEYDIVIVYTKDGVKKRLDNKPDPITITTTTRTAASYAETVLFYSNFYGDGDNALEGDAEDSINLRVLNQTAYDNDVLSNIGEFAEASKFTGTLTKNGMPEMTGSWSNYCYIAVTVPNGTGLNFSQMFIWGITATPEGNSQPCKLTLKSNELFNAHEYTINVKVVD